MTPNYVIDFCKEHGLRPIKVSMSSEGDGAEITFIEGRFENLPVYLEHLIAAVCVQELRLITVDELAPLQRKSICSAMPIVISRVFEATYRKL